MEHIVQFAIGIDDQTIAKRIEENAEKVILKEIKTMIADHIFENRYGKHVGLSGRSAKMVEEWLDQHKQEIIDKAAEHLADKLARTKAVREMVQELKQEG